MEFKIRKSEVGFEYFLKSQIHSIRYVIQKDESYSINYEERVGTFARATRLKELYDLFILSLDNSEKSVVEYLEDPTPITHKECLKIITIIIVQLMLNGLIYFLETMQMSCLKSITRLWDVFFGFIGRKMNLLYLNWVKCWNLMVQRYRDTKKRLENRR